MDILEEKFGEELRVRLLARLNSYLRERMDYIASIPTLDPTWTAPLDIIQDIIDPVWGPETDDCPRLFLLLDNIVRSEGVRAGGLRLVVAIVRGSGRKEFIYEYRYERGKVRYFKTGDKDVLPNHQVATYLGTTGLQAFYALLENFLRNSAKHSDPDRLQSARERSRAIIDSVDSATVSGLQEKIISSTALTVFLEFKYDWAGYLDQYVDDYVKVSMYDNMGGWPDSKGRTVEQAIGPKLDPRREGAFITWDGRIAEGTWGMKELRICASFLRGLRISEYDEPRDLPAIAAREFAYREPEQDRSLGYEFYLPKPKDLLILGDLLPGQFNTDDLKAQGVYVLKETKEFFALQKKRTFTHSFVVIDADSSDPNFSLAFFLEHIKEFPARTFIVTSDVEASIRTINGYARNELSEYLYRPFASHMIAREEWITSTHEARLRLTVDHKAIEIGPFEASQELILELYRRWVELLNSDESLPRGGVVWSGFVDYSEDPISFGSPENLDLQLTSAVVLNHKGDWIPDNMKKRSRFYAPFTHSPPDRLTAIKKVLADSKGVFGKLEYNRVRTYFELLEMALTNIIIIDERIFYEAMPKRPEWGMPLFSYWYLQNVIVANIPEAEKFQCSVLPEALESDALRLETNFDRLPDSLTSLFPAQFFRNVHFLIIHQTIIDKLSGTLDNFLDKLGEYRPRNVVVTSGRGKPEEQRLPPYARFLDFSNLRKYAVERPDKVLLIQMLFSLKEG